jgi:hypothetical protein
MNAPSGYIAHAIAGRTRLKFPAMQGDTEFFADISGKLSAIEGVDSVRDNPTTASVLILHADTDLEAIRTAIAKQALFEFDEAPNHAALSIEKVKQNFRVLDQGLRGASANELDSRLAIFLALVFAGLWQLRKGQILAPAATLFWYAWQLIDQNGKSQK